MTASLALAVDEDGGLTRWYAQLIAENVADLLTLEDASDRYVYVSASCAGLFGWRPEDLHGDRISSRQHPKDAQQVAAARRLLRTRAQASVCHRYRMRCHSGEYRWVESHSRLCDQSPEYIVTLTREIQAHIEQVRDLEWWACCDSLTGLLNRHATEKALDAEFIRSSTQGQVLSVVLFDVDGLKRVNDNHGHLAGDALLRSLASCVARCKRSHDILGRWGGDEFLMVLPGTRAEDVMTLLERVRAAVAHELSGVTLSFGVVSSANAASVRDLLTAADGALYQGKRRGGNEIVASLRP
ncbi:MAG TPA: sensor domain-containing diguanylate cyclase [Steroidobacteraceae bacterium]|nr:sensor domain-containing diguanylate cyclase [Steroidobacteraceae bacterium]